ncbi:TraG family conjugative transposon ATPase [Zunongwangia sp. F363]|uniref:TraG family conjugative transposon ATPase n=1 Tax=Autumnicola tepida TaxID=3075595 RepID=A0ABU3C781_9FLAO|nr:TraG family conjugative transposon ATPase [Zunongwangia sp. F363]MDT0642201.1 TraG family conjugative transposon ATPase [Zunongwangia sp. F363]
MIMMNLYKKPPLAAVSDNLVFASNGNIILAYAVELPEVYSLSEKDFESLHGTWFQALKSLPSRCIVHKQDVYRKQGYKAGQLPGNSFLEKATRKHFEDREFLEHRCYLFFCWPGNKSFNHAKFVNPFKAVSKNLVTSGDEALERFRTAVEDVVHFLNQGQKLRLIPFKEEEVISFAHDYFNGFNEGVDTDILLGDQHIQIGDYYLDLMAVQHETAFGDQLQTSRPAGRFTSDEFNFHQGFIDGFGLELYENHIVNQLLILDDTNLWRRQLEKRMEALKKSASFGTQNLVVLEKINSVLHSISHDEQARIIRGQFSILYWHRDSGRLKDIAATIKAVFKQLDIRPYAPVAESRKQYFLNSFFAFTSNFSNDDLYVTDLKHALCLWLNSGNYRSDKEGVIFNDRQYNIPVIKDVWDEKKRRIKARNFAIFAPTGEGKSFLANNILRQYFEQGVRLVIIDLGGSYAKFAKLYPEEHLVLRYQPGKSLGINFFYLPEPCCPTPEHLEELAVFILELLSSGGAAREETVALKKLLQAYYDSIAAPHHLEGFYRFIEREQEDLLQRLGIHTGYFELSRFLHIISEYVGNGLYSYLFREQQGQSYRLEEKRLIIFELDEIRDNKEILSIMLKLIKTAIQRSIWSNRSERGIILFDEFAKQLKFANVLESVEFYYQAIRKQNGAIGIILQSINQLPVGSTASSILENTQVIYSLRNEKGYEDLVARLKLSSHDLNQLKSITNNLTGSRKYTEVFIKIGKESNIFRLEVPPEAYAAYLTDGAENGAIMALYAKTGNMERAINEYLSAKT